MNDKTQDTKFECSTTFGPGSRTPGIDFTGLLNPSKTYPLIYKKMAAVLAGIGAVGKDQKNTQQGFSFRGIDSMINAVHSVLKEQGVFVTTDILEKKSENREVVRSNGKAGIDRIVELTVRYTFHCEDGSFVSSVIASEGLDNGDKATNKALSAALKYALIQTFQVPTQDMEDADRTSPELVPTRGKEKLPDPVKTVPVLIPPGTVLTPVGVAMSDLPNDTSAQQEPTKKIAPFRGKKAVTVSQLETPKDKPAPEVC